MTANDASMCPHENFRRTFILLPVVLSIHAFPLHKMCLHGKNRRDLKHIPDTGRISSTLGDVLVSTASIPGGKHTGLLGDLPVKTVLPKI